MDPLSIAAGCAGLISTIGTLSLSIHGFVRTCREARRDLDKVSRELQSLQSVLRLIEDDATNEEKPFPPVIGQHVLTIVSNCNSVILEIETCIAQYGQKRLKAQATWATGGQGDVEKLRTSLEAHKSSLELALDMHGLAITKDIKADTTEIRNDTTTIRENTEQILQEIVRLQAQLPKDVTTPNDYVLQRFLEEMTTYTEMALDTTIVGSDDDSIRAFYDIEEVSEASVERKRSDGGLATSNEPQPLNVSEAGGASELSARTNPGGPIEAPIPKSSGGNLGTSDEPQPDKVPSGASAVRTSSSDGLVASKESRPRSSKDEVLAPYVSPNSKGVLASESLGADTTEDKNPKERTVVLNEPMLDTSGHAHVKLLNGNLVVDYRYLNPLATPRRPPPVVAKRNPIEWAIWRFTAVTCPARQFTAENYLLRPLMYSRPKFFRTILSFQLKPGESPAKFAKRWSIIRQGLHRLYELGRGSVVIHVHGPTDWRGLDDNISAVLQEMGINRIPESPIASLDGHKLSHCYNERDRWVLGKKVHCIMRETWTSIYPQKAMFRSRKLQIKADTVMVRITSTAPMTSDDTYQDWVTAIGQQFKSEVVIDMTEFQEDCRSFAWYIQRAQDLHHLPHVKDTWGIGLKFIRFDELIAYLGLLGYYDK